MEESDKDQKKNKKTKTPKPRKQVTIGDIIQWILLATMFAFIIFAQIQGKYIKQEIKIIEVCEGKATQHYNFIAGGDEYDIPEGADLKKPADEQLKNLFHDQTRNKETNESS